MRGVLLTTAALEFTLQGTSHFKSDFLPGGDLDSFTGAGTDAGAGGGGFHTQGAEAGQAHGLPAAQAADHGVEHGADGFLTLFLAETGLVGDHLDELGFADLVAVRGGRLLGSSGGFFSGGLGGFFGHG